MDHTDFEQSSSTLDARGFLRLIRAYWRGIVAIVLLCTLVPLLWSLTQQKLYTSTATGLVVATGEQDLTGALAGVNLAQFKAQSYESVARSYPVAESVVETLALDTPPEVLLTSITTEIPGETVEMRITAEAPSPQAAADLANAWVEALATRVRILEEGGAGEGAGTARVGVQPLSNASLPLEPSSPNLKLNVGLGVLAGLVLGLGYALLRYRMDRRIRSAERVRQEFGLPVLGVLPKDDRLSAQLALVETGHSVGSSAGAFSEALRKLRTNLSFASKRTPLRSVVVTSPSAGEGKSAVTVNLAAAISSTGTQVVVVDADLRDPSAIRLFGLESGYGLTDVLDGRVRSADVLQQSSDFPNLRVLGAGHGVANPTELLSSEVFKQVVDELAQEAFVLIDAPPALPVTDAALLTASADGALIVTTAQGTTIDELSNTLESLERVHGQVLGVVLNRVLTSGPDAADFGLYGMRD